MLESHYPSSRYAPKVSVVMSIYNSAQYLRDSIDSILSQTLEDFEFIIIDDGSIDETSEILDSYYDPRIILIKNVSNLGLTKSLNIGIKASRGELIARHDADDFSEPTMLSEMVNYLDKHSNVGIVGTNKQFVNSNGERTREFNPPLDNTSIQQTLLDWSCIPHGGAIYRSISLKEVGGYNESFRYAQDYDLTLRITEKMGCGKFRKTPLPLPLAQ